MKAVITMRQTLYDYCVERDKDEILQQWEWKKNLPITPQRITYGSHEKMWWRCAKGHEWQTAVYTRTGADSGCPYCAGLRTYLGENDLASQRPDLAAQWHPTKNEGLTPEQVSLGSHKTVWWRCEQGHEWRAMVKTRVVGCGCPVCANRKLVPGRNDLTTTHPDLVHQWHPTKNGKLQPSDVVAGTHRKVWWLCDKGHEWEATVVSRTHTGSGCPVCAGKTVISGENDLASHFPDIAAQWHPTRNGTLRPDKITPCSNNKVWWKCELGHEYQASVGARTISGSGCPYCAGRKVLAGFNDLATLDPDVAEQWHPSLNGTLTPSMVTVGSHRKVWWQCAEGHVWKAVIYSRTGPQKCGCPVCAGRVKQSRVDRYAALRTEPTKRITRKGTSDDCA
jgi:hypothetical protein